MAFCTIFFTQPNFVYYPPKNNRKEAKIIPKSGEIFYLEHPLTVTSITLWCTGGATSFLLHRQKPVNSNCIHQLIFCPVQRSITLKNGDLL